MIKIMNSKSKIVIKKERKMDVKDFVSKSKKFNFKALKLDDGLRKMI